MAQKSKTTKKPQKPKTAKKRHKVNPQKAEKTVLKIFPILKKTYPDATVSLDFENPLQLLIATILAAQCTDRRVNLVTPALFKKYRSARHWARADIKEIEEGIRSTGFFRNKAKNIKAACELITEKFDNKVPATMDELLQLPGVGRKTANVMLGNAFNKQGIVCDTHVIRLSRRLALSENSDPVKLEFDLMQIVPKNRLGGWSMFSHLMVYHGRNICSARKPKCDQCPIKKHCPSADNPVFW